jgi:hypothetical protein
MIDFVRREPAFACSYGSSTYLLFHYLDTKASEVADDVAVPMHDTPLPGGIGEELRGTFRKPHASVRDDQLDAVQAAFLEIPLQPALSSLAPSQMPRISR